MNPGFSRFTCSAFSLFGALAAPVRAQQLITRTPPVDVLLIGVHAVDERVVWASGRQGTWVRTTDGGSTWTAGRVPGADTLEFRDVHAVSADTAWLLSIGSGQASRIYRTNDGGRTWSAQFFATDKRVFLDCFDFWDSRRGLATSDTFDDRFLILSTDDGGERWQEISADRLPVARKGEGMFAASGTCLVTLGTGHAWITTTAEGFSRILRTRDGGKTWAESVPPLPSASATIAMADTLTGLIISSGIDDAQAMGNNVAKTTDGGATWALIGRVPDPVYGAAVRPGTETVIATGPKGSHISFDGGRNWRPLSSENQWSVTFSPGGTGWMVGAKGRITRVEF
jgi:photosystem II stability/assembly factor-like uncharacterized protein